MSVVDPETMETDQEVGVLVKPERLIPDPVSLARRSSTSPVRQIV